MKILHPHLNRSTIDYYTDLYWSHIGPDHVRASFHLLYLFDVASEWGRKGAPYYASNGFGFRKGDRKIPKKEYATIPAAKRAARAWFINWLQSTGGPIEWEASETGVHFVATADGLEIGSYYHCAEATKEWHQGFRAHFGMTFYSEQYVTTPERAKEVIAETWATWLELTRARFLGDANRGLDGKKSA